MLPSLFAALACTAPLTTQATAPAPIEVCLHVGATSFRALNRGEQPLLLVFHADGNVALQVLPAYAEVAWSFPRHALDGIAVEVASRRLGAWVSTGTLALGGLLVADEGELWITSTEDGASAYAVTASGLEPVAASAGALTSDDDAPLPGATGPGPMHVPVITPSDVPQGDLPPKIEEQPLPPV